MATLAEEREYLENELRSYRYIVDQCYRWEQVIVNAEIAIYGVISPHAKDVTQAIRMIANIPHCTKILKMPRPSFVCGNPAGFGSNPDWGY